MKQSEIIIQKLNLQPHPEGGYYSETYRSSGKIKQDNLDSVYKGKRNYSTCIYFLLTSETFSAFHKIHQDEIWHYYDGSPLNLHIISPEGEYSKIIIGRNIENGQVPQFIVKGGNWFAADIINDDDFTLLGCTVSPGFDYNDFELAKRNELIEKFPQHKKIIAELTRG
ncbi:MAG TPA: cupin domain-containing protein [Bacteroidales bacterium]|nr:cupin domain-containing protein [Bacteroidales bacterium]HPS15628.1 cupin domain-containing protein [Bacteroidales bacterium]